MTRHHLRVHCPIARATSAPPVRLSDLILALLTVVLLGGLALAFENDAVIRALPWVTAALTLGNAYWITRLPPARHQERRSALESAVAGATAAVPGALRNPGYLATAFFGGVLNTNQVLLQIVIPLWLVEETDAPRVLLAWLFGTNTVMCIFLPMLAARGVREAPAWEHVDATLRRVGSTMVRAAQGSQLQRFGFTPEEAEVAQLLQTRPLRILDVTTMLGASVGQVFLYFLMIMKQVELVDPAVGRAAAPTPPLHVPSSSSMPARTAPLSVGMMGAPPRCRPLLVNVSRSSATSARTAAWRSETRWAAPPACRIDRYSAASPAMCSASCPLCSCRSSCPPWVRAAGEASAS